MAAELTEESQFLKLFKEALDIIKKTMDVHLDELERGMETFRVAFRYDLGNSFSDIDFNKTENLCAYFYRMGPLAFSLTKNRILEGLNECEEFASKFRDEQVNIVSIGCGPGSDIVGLCSALSKMPFRKMKLTLVDTVKRWSSFFNILEFLMREGEFGCASDLFHRVDVSTTFLCEDMSLPHMENTAYFPALREADIILMKDVFSIVPFSEMNAFKRNIVKGMKPGALLLYIDSRYFGFDGLEILYTNSDEVLNFDGRNISMSVDGGLNLTNFFSQEKLDDIEKISDGFAMFSKSQLVILKK